MLATLIASIASGEIAASLERAKSAAVAYAVAGIAAFFGLIFLLVAAYIFAADRYGAITAALSFGAGFIVVAILVIVINRMDSRVVRRRARRRRGSEAKALGATAAIALAPMILSRVRLPFLAIPLLGGLGYAIYNENRRRRPRMRDVDREI